LAILAFAGGATVLAFDADRFGALLEEASFIDDQHRILVAEVLDDVALEIIANLVSVPVSGSEQALDAIGSGGTEMFGDLPAILAFNWADEGTKVVEGELARFGAHKVPGNVLIERGETDSPAANLSGIEVLVNHALMPPFLTAWLLFYQVRL
jgi:hypothetical protein